MNKRVSKALDEFLDDMLKISHQKGFAAFFYRSRAHVMVVLLICKSSIRGEEIGFEDICHYIPKYITSRSTIKTILDTGSSQRFFLKLNSKKDLRKKIYFPSHEVKMFMSKWIQRNKEIFQDTLN